MKSNIFVSFSGGRTSAFMSYMLKQYFDGYANLVFIFANTGQEHNRTLDFVDRCDKEWGLNVVWLEAAVNPAKGKGTSYKIVDYNTASRITDDRPPFESVIEKYGIPNKAYPHCTRELKLAPMQAFVKRELGWRDFYTAIGIRNDESHRVVSAYPQKRILYPLIDIWPTSKQEVLKWWGGMPFDLGLAEHLGNCVWCWKKSFKKHMRVMRDMPEAYQFPERMEEKHGLSGHNVDGTKRVFFRQNMSTRDVKTIYEEGGSDDIDMGAAGSCSESCEVFGDGTRGGL